MKTKLNSREYVTVASMLFGMFFGAGNLIFPVYMGQQAGSHVWAAVAGFLITGVGMPLLGVAALGLSRSSSLFDLSQKVNRPYAMFFTCLLYLTIGPFFAIPRCATTSFTVGLEQVLPAGHARLYLLLFSLIFFAVVLFFALRPGKISSGSARCSTPFSCSFWEFWSSSRCCPRRRPSPPSPPLAAMPPSRFLPAFSRATTLWTRWRVSPSASLSFR